MSPQQPRRPASSRGATPRPRRIAGHGPESSAPDPVLEETSVEEAETVEKVEKVGEVGEEKVPAEAVAEPHVDEPDTDPDAESDAQPDAQSDTQSDTAKTSMFAGRQVTRALLIGLGVLVVLLVLQGAWFLQHQLRKPDDKPVAAGDIAVPAGRPVVLNQSDVDQGVNQAAKDAVVLIRRNFKHYDDDVTKAMDLMTARFATEFKQTTADVKQAFVAKRTNVDAKVVAQGVVKANSTQLQALLFLDQYVTKGSGKKRRLTYTPYKVLVTMIHTDHGWLVDHLDTK